MAPCLFARRASRLVLACAALAASLAVTAPVVSAQNYTWQNVPIRGGGFVSGLVFHPTAANVLYARTDVGGAYRWNNTNSTWTPINDDLTAADSQLHGVVSLAVDPSDANRLYLACGLYTATWARNAAILRSTDRGATWSRTELNPATVGATIRLGGNQEGRNTGERLVVDPNLGTTLFLGTNQDGLWKSTDRGVTWARVTAFAPTSVTFTAFDQGSGFAGGATPVIYVGVNDLAGPCLYRSTNGGATWAAVAGAPAGVIPHNAAFDTNRNLFLAFSNGLGPNGVTNGSAWKLSPTGAWTNITPLVPGATGSGGNFGYSGITVKGGGSTAQVYLTTLCRWASKDELFRSTDGGATWTALRNIDTYSAPDAPWVFGTGTAAAHYAHWITDIAIDPASNRVFYVGGTGVWSSPDAFASAVTWTFTNNGLEETVPIELVSPPSGAPLLSALGDIGGFRHDSLLYPVSLASYWNPAGGSNHSISFAAQSPSFIVRTHSANGIQGAYSTTGGSSWTNFTAAPASFTGSTIDTSGDVTVNATATRIVWNPFPSIPYYSANNGATWTASTGVPSGENRVVADPVNANKFYVYNGTTLYVSTDGGVGFSAAATGLATGARRLQATPGVEGHLWLPANDGLRRSTDSGLTFALVPGFTRANQVGLGIAAPGLTYPAIYVHGILGGVEGVYRSTDNCASWIRINTDAQRYGWINTMTGDARTFGRVYLGTAGRGIVYGNAPAGLVADGIFRVTNVASGKVLDVSGWNTADGSNVGHYGYNGGANQRWAFTHLGGNRYRITGIHSAKPLTDSAFDADANVDISAPAADDDQVWTLAAVSGGYTLTNLATARRLEVDSATGGTVIESTAAVTTKQTWTILAP